MNTCELLWFVMKVMTRLAVFYMVLYVMHVHRIIAYGGKMYRYTKMMGWKQEGLH